MLRSLWGMSHPGSAALPKPAGISLLFFFVLLLSIAITIGGLMDGKSKIRDSGSPKARNLQSTNNPPTAVCADGVTCTTRALVQLGAWSESASPRRPAAQ